MAAENIASEADRAKALLGRLARLSAWVVLVGVIVLVLSGWGITQTGIIYRLTFGLVDRRLADTIHRSSNMPLAFFFLSYVLVNIKLAISHKRPAGEWLINSILIVIGGLLMASVVYMEYFRLGG
jgi:hypothetical protein